MCPAAIIGREITMSALREWAAALGGEAHQAVAVSGLGKWKTATQVQPAMCSMRLLAVSRAAWRPTGSTNIRTMNYVLTDGVADAAPGRG